MPVHVTVVCSAMLVLVAVVFAMAVLVRVGMPVAMIMSMLVVMPMAVPAVTVRLPLLLLAAGRAGMAVAMAVGMAVPVAMIVPLPVAVAVPVLPQDEEVEGVHRNAHQRQDRHDCSRLPLSALHERMHAGGRLRRPRSRQQELPVCTCSGACTTQDGTCAAKRSAASRPLVTASPCRVGADSRHAWRCCWLPCPGAAAVRIPWTTSQARGLGRSAACSLLPSTSTGLKMRWMASTTRMPVTSQVLSTDARAPSTSILWYLAAEGGERQLRPGPKALAQAQAHVQGPGAGAAGTPLAEGGSLQQGQAHHLPGSAPEGVRAVALLGREEGCEQRDRKAADVRQEVRSVRHDGQAARQARPELGGAGAGCSYWGGERDQSAAVPLLVHRAHAAGPCLLATKPPTTSTIMNRKQMTSAATSLR